MKHHTKTVEEEWKLLVCQNIREDLSYQTLNCIPMINHDAEATKDEFIRASRRTQYLMNS